MAKFKGGKDVAITAVISAILVVSKFALSFIPNVEVVTTLVICFTFVFGFKGVFATFIFCTADILIYPPSIDVIISYYIYWDLLALIVVAFREFGVKNKNAYLILGLVMTLIFGAITSFFNHLFYGTPFLAVYLAGIYFYAIQLVSTLVFLGVGFTPIVKVLSRIEDKIYN